MEDILQVYLVLFFCGTNASVRHIYISPHLDDAVLSVGGLIHAQQRENKVVEIWTIMAGTPTTPELSPFAQDLHSSWGTKSAEESLLIRRTEDHHAAKILGVQTIHYEFLDAIYRRDNNDQWLYEDIFIPPHVQDSRLATEITEAISTNTSSDDILYCPLAIGLHVDHVIVRQVVEALVKRPIYYADLPYLFKNAGQAATQAHGMIPNVQPLSKTDVDHWLEAIRAYKSQLSTLFDNIEALFNVIRVYWEEWGGVPVWKLE